MAISSPALRRFAEVTGWPYTRLERLTRPLKEADPPHWVRRGDGELPPENLASLVLALAADLPIEALDAVKKLGATVPSQTPRVAAILQRQPENLLDMLTSLIALAPGDRFAGGLAALQHLRWRLTMCLDPVVAWVTTAQDDASQTEEVWLPPSAAFDVFPRALDSLTGARRLTTVSADVLLAAGEIIANTGASASSRSSGSASNDAGSGNDSGGALGSAAAPLPVPSESTETRQATTLVLCAQNAHLSTCASSGRANPLTGISHHGPPSHYGAPAPPD